MPTPAFLHLIPVLDSTHVDRDVAWYIAHLGFRLTYDSTQYHAGPMDYAVLERAGMILHLQFQYPKDFKATDIKFEVKGIQTLFEALQEKGLVKREQFRTDTPWHTDEFGLKDPSGNRIFFLEERMG
ncbi:MAG: glyoxalase superfamily protein [Bacteroidota bacterium]